MAGIIISMKKISMNGIKLVNEKFQEDNTEHVQVHHSILSSNKICLKQALNITTNLYT